MRIFAIATLALIGATSFAQNAYFTGALTANDPTFNRPIVGGGALSGTATSVFYDVQPFYVAASGTFTYESVAPPTNDIDTFIIIYQNIFNPATPLVNHVASNDDFTGAFTILPGPYGVPGSGTGFTGAAPASRVSGVSLSSGVQYYAVNTSFSNGDVGTYFSGIGGNSVTGAPVDVLLGNLPVVPEPASLVALGVGALALMRKRKKS